MQAPSSTKQELRAKLRARRRAIAPAQQAKAALAVRDRLLRWSLFPRGGSVAAYLAHDGEVSLQPLIEAAWNMGVRIYLPVVTGPGRMLFRHHRRGGRLTKNALGILEPRHPGRVVELSALDLVLVPLVGFDRAGHRLGMGGGFYDRALVQVAQVAQATQTTRATQVAKVTQIARSTQVAQTAQAARVAQAAQATQAPRAKRRALRVVGVAHSCQMLEGVPVDPWDRRLEWVLTERALMRCGPGARQE